MSGWPKLKSQVNGSVREYWNVRDELSVIDDIIFKSDRIVIPTAVIHQGHMGVERSKRRANDVLYWPGINSQINDMVSKCTVCPQHRRENTKEKVIPFRIPCHPWELVATDLFKLDNLDYLLVVDYYSRFFEVG